jgi:3-oxo-5-alpha-steroid 4-dehydrogenase 1
MITPSVFYFIVYLWIAIGLVSFPFVLRNVAPYGRHTSSKWGAMISNRWGWVIMEAPALLVFVIFFLMGSPNHNAPTWIFFSLYAIHYINRDIIFPFRLRTKGKRMPLAIMFMAIFFNLVNGFINGYYLGNLADEHTAAWLQDPRFIGGIFVFFAGMAINMQSDNILIHLRKPGETGYVIPGGGLFKYISCPNHFGEILEWFGYALMTWSSPGLAFAVWTLVNLLPRALHHHRWYQATFTNYPAERKAVLPYLL